MPRYLLIACLIAVAFCDTSIAQRRLPLRPGGGRPSGGLQIQRDGDSTNRRKDVEGTIWEFKVMDSSDNNKSKRTKMTGRIRIKQSSVFAIGKVELSEEEGHNGSGDGAQMMKEFDNNGDNRLDVAELDALLVSMREGNSGQAATSERGVSSDVQGELSSLLSQRIKQAQEQDTGGERIGDMTKSKSKEKTFRFDEDDDHPLSGMVVVRPDTKKSNGAWFGRYDEFSDGKKKKRWRFEMRKIEE